MYCSAYFTRGGLKSGPVGFVHPLSSSNPSDPATDPATEPATDPATDPAMDSTADPATDPALLELSLGFLTVACRTARCSLSTIGSQSNELRVVVGNSLGVGSTSIPLPTATAAVAAGAAAAAPRRYTGGSDVLPHELWVLPTPLPGFVDGSGDAADAALPRCRSSDVLPHELVLPLPLPAAAAVAAAGDADAAPPRYEGTSDVLPHELRALPLPMDNFSMAWSMLDSLLQMVRTCCWSSLPQVLLRPRNLGWFRARDR